MRGSYQRLFFLFFVLVFNIQSSKSAEIGCSLETLQGNYIFSAQGWAKSEQKGYRPIAYIGMLFFEGNGKVTSKLRTDNSKATQNVKGTYTLGSNCEAEVTYKNGRKATYFVSPSGDMFSLVVTSGLVTSADAHRVSKGSPAQDKPVKPAPDKSVKKTKKN